MVGRAAGTRGVPAATHARRADMGVVVRGGGRLGHAVLPRVAGAPQATGAVRTAQDGGCRPSGSPCGGQRSATAPGLSAARHRPARSAERACAQAGSVPGVTFEAAAPSQLAQLATRGLGAAVVPAVPPDTASRLGLRILSPGPEPRARVGLTWRTGGPAGPAARALLTRLRTALAAPADADVPANTADEWAPANRPREGRTDGTAARLYGPLRLVPHARRGGGPNDSSTGRIPPRTGPYTAVEPARRQPSSPAYSSMS
ncbi:LysR substrate-binding domain-containing protein [Streptomyces albus]|uniref:LysR substrate-binding domain-containing protein n=2 Tax=Streptomyces TaxID=1883 RepID=UPI00379C7ECB